jgi:hypothetical protein
VPAAVADNLAASPDMVQSQGALQGAASLHHSVVPQAARSTPSAQDGLLRGAKVSGSLFFNGVINFNYFNFSDTGSNSIPAGWGNSPPYGPSDVPVNDTQTEFGVRLSFPLLADLTTDGFISIKEGAVITGGFSAGEHQYVLTSSAFVGLTATNISNTFPAEAQPSASLQGDTLTVNVSEYRSDPKVLEFKIRLKVRCGTS